MTTIALVAGEVSGDYLGAGLIRALKQRLPDCRFVGIAGPQMIEAGCEAWYPAEKLAVMGFAEVIFRLPEIFGIRKKLRQRLLEDPPDLFIGIDAPDFNLTLEEQLHQAGIHTMHYVSPSVWAWRAERIHKIKRAVDMMLTLFPFEADFYRQHQVPVHYVGHPLADQIPLQPDRAAAREALGLSPQACVIGVLPGSRRSEVQRIGPIFCEAMRLCHAQRPDLEFIVPMATPATRTLFENIVAEHAADLPIRLYDRQSREVMTAADALMVASGTATLEALLCKRPMVVAYRMARSTWWHMQRKFIVDRYALPNHLAGHDVVKECYQEQADPRVIADEVLRLLADEQGSQALMQEFTEIHRQLRCNASEQAADAVMELLSR